MKVFFSCAAGDELAVAVLMRAAQSAEVAMLVLETMSCLWAIMTANKVLESHTSLLPQPQNPHSDPCP